MQIHGPSGTERILGSVLPWGRGCCRRALALPKRLWSRPVLQASRALSWDTQCDLKEAQHGNLVEGIGGLSLSLIVSLHHHWSMFFSLCFFLFEWLMLEGSCFFERSDWFGFCSCVSCWEGLGYWVLAILNCDGTIRAPCPWHTLPSWFSSTVQVCQIVTPLIATGMVLMC